MQEYPNMTDLASFYRIKIDDYKASLVKISKKLFLISAARLIAFLIIVASVYLFTKNGGNPALIAGILTITFFLYLVKASSSYTYEKELMQKRLSVNENELSIIHGETNSFDNGLQFQTGESYFADLDIFGAGSLFHLLNRTSTVHGATAMAATLQNPRLDPAKILEHQDAIRTFAPQAEVRELIIAKSLLHSKGASNLEVLQLWVQHPAKLVFNRYMTIARFLLPAINIVALIDCFLSGQYYFLSMTVLITWFHIGFFARYTQQEHLMVSKKEESLRQYASVLETFEKAEVNNSSVLQRLHQKCSDAHVEIRRLSALANMLDQRLNLLVNIFLNSFLMYEVQCVFALEKWKQQNSPRLAEWILAVGDIESLTGFATFAFNNPAYTYPVLRTGSLAIEGEELSHPLMRREQSISNDLSIGRPGRLMLITGSNMSGKTTFLRTVGVNTLLAQCGSPVCASKFHFTPVRIYTSIRISDSLQENTSYFMAELKRLHEIKQEIAGGVPSLILIDEILRGTNSDDKYHGSGQFMLRLLGYNCLTLFATHDLKLSELEARHPGGIENFCFESTIKNDELYFDYKIRRGVAQNRNASFLMKKMEII